ncbi:MAG TPA: DUF1501 domain-containing protein [Pirellulales bacterium]|nr:DUF1501 domain-containing protein [Pirellulales bacterium]
MEHATHGRAFGTETRPVISRRQTLALGGSLLSGLNLLGPSSAAAARTIAPRPTRAKSVIMLYLHGGAPTQDMFDMKPTAPVEVRGEFKPIATNVPGIEICEHLPRMTKWMHRAAVIRSVYHRSGCHNEIPSFTGYEPPPGDAQAPPDNLPPSMGSVCEYLKPSQENCPAYVHLPVPLAYNGSGESGPGAGFLGRRYDPLVTAATPTVDEGADVRNRAHPPQVRGLPRLADSQLSNGLTLERLARRQSLLTGIEAHRSDDQQSEAGAEVVGVQNFKRRAFDLLASPVLRGCFDPALVDQRVRERYGNTLFGNSAFIASKLVASGCLARDSGNANFFRDQGLSNRGAKRYCFLGNLTP